MVTKELSHYAREICSGLNSIHSQRADFINLHYSPGHGRTRNSRIAKIRINKTDGIILL